MKRRGKYRAIIMLILGFAVAVFLVQMVALSRLSSPVSRYPWEDQSEERRDERSLGTVVNLALSHVSRFEIHEEGRAGG